jgi:hypothetical protein
MMFTLRRASLSSPSGHWSEDDYDVVRLIQASWSAGRRLNPDIFAANSYGSNFAVLVGGGT